MNMGNEERVSKVTSRFNLNPDQRIRFCVGAAADGVIKVIAIKN